MNIFLPILIGFDLSSWKTSLGFGSLLTHEQTKLLLRELGVEEYVGVGCSRNSVPYFPQTQAGWNVPTGMYKFKYMYVFECKFKREFQQRFFIYTQIQIVYPSL